MNTHIINFAVGFDDEPIIKAVCKNAEQQIIKELKRDVINALFTHSKYYYKEVTFTDNGDVKNATELDLTPVAEEFLKNIIEEHKELIFDKAAQYLAESFKRTKAWKEKAGSVIE